MFGQVHEYSTVIKERNLDSFGHVNNAQYMALFEEARWEMVTERGYGLEDVLKGKISTVVLEATLRFKRELKNREKIKIVTQVDTIESKLVRLNQKILKESGEISCEGWFVLGCFDLLSRKLIKPTSEWLGAISGSRE